ncbi:uncharacterized protein LOC142318340 isoform X2 [Lycorma delicatula]|uniref:uncharacterized protein LOC142318340 isoform X2 n=1 Tax=Lycorma delicatula TaxID=130591 RepID=UPI003F512E56
MAEYEDETVPSILLPCTSCSRTFRPEALAKHTKYCEKTLIKKRKVFDSAKQRIQGTDLAEFLPVLTHKKKVEKSPIRKTQSKWKEKHMELVRAIRAARVGSSSEELPPAPVKPSDHEQCPHCDRYFGPKAYDRHLEWCKEHSTRIQPKSPASIQAKERLEARTKYRAPVLAKSRRTVTKEKYQLQRNRIRDPSPKETPPKNVCNRLRDPSPMERNKNIPSSQVSLKQPAGLPKGELNVIDSASRLQLHRSSRRHPSPMKKTSVTVRSRNSESTKNISIQKEVSHLTNRNINNLNSCQDKEDIFSSSCNISSIRPVESPKPKLKVASNTSTSASHNSSLENYDPYKSAERQMKELLGLEDDVTTEIHHEEEDNKEKKEQISCISQTNIISSPTSAFAKFSPIEPARSPDFLENDFIPPPEKFDSIHNQSSHSIIESDCVKDKNQNPISLSSLSLCSTISIDSVDSYKNNFRKGISTSAKVQSCDKKVELPLKRSISAVEPHRKGRDFLKSNLKMEHLLFGFPADNYDRFLGTPINDINPNENKSLESLSLSNESLKRSDSVEETSRAEQELLKSMSEFEKLFESPLKPVPPLIPSSNPTPVPLPHGDMNNSSENSKPETQQLSTGNKFSSDSAYNSLNRKSPQMNDLVVSENEDTSQLIASGGTEGSFTSAASQNSHAARFCHECGSKYPVLAAKFCCHCGVRRLVI